MRTIPAFGTYTYKYICKYIYIDCHYGAWKGLKPDDVGIFLAPISYLRPGVQRTGRLRGS